MTTLREEVEQSEEELHRILMSDNGMYSQFYRVRVSILDFINTLFAGFI